MNNNLAAHQQHTEPQHGGNFSPQQHDLLSIVTNPSCGRLLRARDGLLKKLQTALSHGM
jgi:hypothetical protein